SGVDAVLEPVGGGVSSRFARSTTEEVSGVSSRFARSTTEEVSVVERASAASETKRRATGMDSCTARHQPPVGDFDPDAPDESAAHRRDANFAVRLGLAGVKGIGKTVAERIVTAR